MAANKVYDVEGRSGETKEVVAGNGLRQCIYTSVMAVCLMTVLVLCLLYSTSAHSASAPTYEWPGPSPVKMGKFTKLAVSADHTICGEFGKEIMAAGGNAVDGAITTMFCLGATNPQSSGLGGGFLMTLYNSTTGKCVAIDAREAAPAAATETMFANDPDGSKYGFKAAGVPGELAGYWEIFTRFGSGNIPWPELVRPTIRLLNGGVPVSEFLEATMKVKERHFRLFPSMKEWINPATNETYKAGNTMPRRKLLETLHKIANAHNPADLFYRGEFADIIHKEMKENGGILTKEDLASYRVRVYESDALVGRLPNGLAICGGPPPSGFAVTQLVINLMNSIYPNGTREQLQSDPLFYHNYIEAMKFAYAQRTLLGDAEFVPSAKELAQKLVSIPYTKMVLKRMKKKAQPTAYYGGDGSAQSEDHGTSHVSVLDEHGNGVAATTTINRWFGAAVESQLGIIYNDEMDDFSTPGQVNGFGFAPSKTNFIVGGKRPMSSMSPLIMYNEDTHKIRLVGGASGGSKIISALSKAIIRSVMFGETIKEAIDSPMIHNQFTPDITQLDDRFPLPLKNILEKDFGQKFRNSTGFEGVVQAIHVVDKTITSSGDFRRKTDQTPQGI